MRLRKHRAFCGQDPDPCSFLDIRLSALVTTALSCKTREKGLIFWNMQCCCTTKQDRVLLASCRTSSTLGDGKHYLILFIPPISVPVTSIFFPTFKFPIRGKRYSSVEEAFAADQSIRDAVLRPSADGIPRTLGSCC